MEPSWDVKEQGGRRGPRPGGAEQERGLLTPRATSGQREAQGQQDGTRGAELGAGQASCRPSTKALPRDIISSERKPTLLGLTKLTLGMGFEVDLVHLVVGDSLEQKVVVVSQLVATFQLASTTVNKVLLNLQARGFWYKVFTGPPLVKHLVQASIVPASTSKVGLVDLPCLEGLGKELCWGTAIMSSIMHAQQQYGLQSQQAAGRLGPRMSPCLLTPPHHHLPDPCLMLKDNLGEPAGPDTEVPFPAFSTHSDSIPSVLLYASTTSTSSATSSNNPCSSAPASKATHVEDITTSSSEDLARPAAIPHTLPQEPQCSPFPSPMLQPRPSLLLRSAAPSTPPARRGLQLGGGGVQPKASLPPPAPPPLVAPSSSSKHGLPPPAPPPPVAPSSSSKHGLPPPPPPSPVAPSSSSRHGLPPPAPPPPVAPSSSSKHGLPPPASLLPNPTLRAVRWVAPELPITLPSEQEVQQALPATDRARLLGTSRARYGADVLYLTPCLKRELAALRLLATRPEANTLRMQVGWQHPLSQPTWERFQGLLSRWLGFLQLLQPSHPLTLHTYVHDTPTFLLYLAFLKARAKGCPTEAQKHLQLAGYVCNWLAFTNVGEEWSCWVLSTLVPFYSRLSIAMGRVGSHRHAVLETQALVSPLSPPKAQEVLVWQEKVKDVALEALGSFGPGEQLPTKVARVVRDASMLCTGFGHSSLAQRSQVMVTAKASQHAITPCGMPNCPGMEGGCKGNRFEYDGATAAWRLVVPHSKNSSKGVPGIVLPLTDTKEVKLLEAYECQARPVLLGQIGTHEHVVEAMYLNNKGQPYTIESLAMWWRRTYKSNQAPWPFVPFHELRNVFITDRLDNPDMPGPSIQAAAQAMLNSPAQWGASYDMNKRQRLGKEAQATMPLYRKAMLQASPKPLSNMVEGLAGVGQLDQAQQDGGVEEGEEEY